LPRSTFFSASASGATFARNVPKRAKAKKITRARLPAPANGAPCAARACSPGVSRVG
jgi:hypothetical protein